jgi:hypothetical protein
MRTFSRAQNIVATIICRRCHASCGGDFGAKQGELFAEQALQPAHGPYRHTEILPRSNGVAVAERVSPVLFSIFIESLVPRC